MRLAYLLLPLLLLTLVPAWAGHKAPKIFLRIYVQTTGNGQADTASMPCNLPPDGETILIRSLPEITEKELIAVKQDTMGNVRLLFNHEGQVNLSAVTAQNQGRILVLMIDGYVTYAPVIDEQITSGELDIPKQLSPQVMQLLQETAADNVREAGR